MTTAYDKFLARKLDETRFWLLAYPYANLPDDPWDLHPSCPLWFDGCTHAQAAVVLGILRRESDAPAP